MFALPRPQYWASDGDSPQCFPVKAWSEEGMAVAGYFLEGMPESTEIDVIERWEHGPLFGAYCQCRDDILRDLGCNPKPGRANAAREAVEAWLFSGTGVVDEVLTEGFPDTDVNMHESKFGLGVYFARDPRLPHFVLNSLGLHRQGKFQVILARVAVGLCWRQTAIRKANDPVKEEHCCPPPGHHSCTLQRSPGCEVIVFPGNGGMPAYPAYVVTYRSPARVKYDPYEELAMLRLCITKGKVVNGHPFKQYKDTNRPNWRSSGSGLGTTQAQAQALCSLRSLADWRARGDRDVICDGEVLPAGSPISAIRARHLEHDPDGPDLDADMTTTTPKAKQACNQSRQPLKSSSAPMLAMAGVHAVASHYETPPLRQAPHPKWKRALNSSSLPQAGAHLPGRTQSATIRSESAVIAQTQSASSFRSQNTSTAMSMRPECADDLSKALGSYSGAIAIEVANLPDLSSSGLAPEVYMAEMLNPKLRLLRDFDASLGEAVRRAWVQNDGESVALELQSKWLVASTARILDDLPLFGVKLQVRIIPLGQRDSPEASQPENHEILDLGVIA